MTALALEAGRPRGVGGGPTAEEFEEYVATHQHRLLGFALKLTRNPHEAEDLVQAALEKTSAGRHRLRSLESLDAYVRQAIVNTYRSLWRRAWKHSEFSRADLPETVVPADGTDVETRDALVRLIGELPPGQRDVLALRYLEDRSVAETAELLGCPVGTVKSHTFRALANLRERLADDPLMVA